MTAQRHAEETLWEGNPHWLGMLGFYIKGFFGAFLLGLPFLLAAKLDHFNMILAFVILVALIGLVIGIAWIKQHTTSYKITDRLICQSQGIINRDWDTTPIVRLQDISVNQNIFERMLGFGTIEYENAAGVGGKSVGKEFIWLGVKHPRKLADLVEDVRSGAFSDRKDIEREQEMLSLDTPGDAEVERETLRLDTPRPELDEDFDDNSHDDHENHGL